MSDETAQNPDGDALGELTVSELRSLEALRKNQENVVREIGMAEVRKANLLMTLQEVDQRMQAVLQTAAKRLNLPPKEPWHVTPEGKVRRGPG